VPRIDRGKSVAMEEAQKASSRGKQPWALPALVFLVLVGLTTAVWHQQVRHQRELLARHTDDVCTQVSRRLEVFVEARLAVAQTFAKRWATHEQQDFSERRFTAFARVVLGELPDYRSLALLSATGDPTWIEPASSPEAARFLEQDQGRTLREVQKSGRPALSEPVQLGPGQVGYFAAVPLLRDTELLGYLLIELRTDMLFDEAMHPPIRGEFGFTVTDGDRAVLSYLPDMDESAFRLSQVLSSRTFPVWNRSWQMTVAPQRRRALEATWWASYPIPALGLVLSLGLAALSFLLLQRIRAYRLARDEALHELAERRKAEQARQASEARYRSVFDSSSDGLVVVAMDGRIVEANAAACTMHGFAEGELEGRLVRELVAEDHQSRVDEFMAQLKAAGSVRMESVNVRKDGGKLDVEVRGSRLGHEGKPAVLAVLRDVTEQRRAMQQLMALSRQVLAAQEEERARLSRDLHDGLGQELTALRFEIDWLSKSCKAKCDKPLSFGHAGQMLESSAKKLRELCQGLRPPLLDDVGLESAIQQLVDNFEAHSAVQGELEVHLDEQAPQLAPEAALCAYRVVQEALTNVNRHAAAKNVRVVLRATSSELAISVQDDGAGFDPSNGRPLSHLGIAGMRERASLVRGKLELHSQIGKGTRVELRIPIVTPVRQESTVREENHDSHISSG